tara:strand:- start:517 stop:1236 length:720 start_codon:yes stop_codon:yes gene_type:complete
MDSRLKVNLIIPCFNEGESLKVLYEKIDKFISEFDCNVCFYILDNGSSDNTAEIIKNFKINKKIKFLKLINNEGYGNGVNFGIHQVNDADLVGWFHGDLQFELDDLYGIYVKLEKLLKKNENKIFFKGTRYGRSILSSIFSFFMGLIATILLRDKFYEINAQPTIFSTDLLKKIDNPPKDFSFDTYLYWLAKKNKYFFIRQKVKFPKRVYGQSNWDLGLTSKIKFSFKNLKYILSLMKH